MQTEMRLFLKCAASPKEKTPEADGFVHRKWGCSSPVETGGVGIHCGVTRELLTTPILAMTVPFHALACPCAKATKQ